MTTSLIPEPSLRRLPKYHHFLVELRERGIHEVSCTTIGEALNLLPIQVRKDLQYTGIVGRPKVGFQLAELIQAIETFLGWDNTNDAFLVGAGNLGSALLGYERFEKFGLSIVAAFDNNPNIVGTSIHKKLVLPMEKLVDLAQRMAIHIGIITTPAAAAQQAADQLVKAGVRAIWNFAPTTLNVPPNVILQNEDLYNSLAALSCRLAKAMQTSGESTYGTRRNERAEVRTSLSDPDGSPEEACSIGAHSASDTK
jgi:redox-sensing transcriptional repressor